MQLPVRLLLAHHESSGGRLRAELPHHHADFAVLDLRERLNLPIPENWIVEVAAFAQRFELNPLLIGSQSDDVISGNIFSILLDQHRAIARWRLDATKEPGKNKTSHADHDHECGDDQRHTRLVKTVTRAAFRKVWTSITHKIGC